MKKISMIGALALVFLWIRTMEFFLTHSPWFGLKVIEISGNEELSQDEVLRYAGLRLRRNIYTIDLKGTAKRIESDKRIKSIELKRFFPGKIEIRVDEKIPDLLVNSKYMSRLYGLSAEGEIIPLKDYCSYDLPLISGTRSGGFKPYTRIKDMEVLTALSFYKMVQDEDPSFLEKISEINLEDKSNLVVIMVTTGAKVFFGTGDYKEKFKRFIWLNENLNYEGYSGLDLRFKDQVIFKGVK